MTARLYMPHAGHFICGRDCGFRLNTYVNGYIVSTVGELKYGADNDAAPYRSLGGLATDLYETMVFTARPSGRACCPWEQTSGADLACRRYTTADEATAGHEAMVQTYERPEMTAPPKGDHMTSAELVEVQAQAAAVERAEESVREAELGCIGELALLDPFNAAVQALGKARHALVVAHLTLRNNPNAGVKR